MACAILAASALVCAAKSKKDATHKREAGPEPAARIEVAPLGYSEPSRFYMVARVASTTVDFIDDDHLLFTFREGGLLKRLPGDPEDDSDRLVRAMVLDIPSGKVVQQAQWRMHDRQRYLWAIGDGEFVVRQRNALYLTGSDLELRPYVQFADQLEGVSVSPDHKLMTIELEKFEPLPEVSDSERDSARKAPTLGDSPRTQARRKYTQILIVRPHDNKVIARSEAVHYVDMPLLENGFLEVLEGKQPDRWVIRNKPFLGDASDVIEVKSACDPSITTLSATVGLSMGCPGGSNDHAVTAFSTQGKVLWQDRWLPRYIWPTFEFAENGSRFAYASLELTHSLGTMDPFDEEDVIAQMVGVFDTQSGKLELAKTASPILSAGHNYALSADGTRFAILREGALEIYHLLPAGSAPAAIAAAASPK
jgi:hypothetical protein